MNQTNDNENQEAILQIENSSTKLAQTIHQALIPEIQTSNLGDAHVKVLRNGKLLFFHFKTKNSATLRALINSYLRWIITIQKSLDINNLKNSTSISHKKDG